VPHMQGGKEDLKAFPANTTLDAVIELIRQ
jgi:hypothetical protein